jgi:hypothetical protein
MEIFQASCPSCDRRFDCDVALLAADIRRWRCPWCNTYFAREESPSVFTSRDVGSAPATWEGDGVQVAIEMVEFAGHDPDAHG